MRINHNIAALRSNGQLKANNEGLTKSLEKLSSGYRINRASDDAAGMAISQKMKTQIRGLEMASRNAADGVSVIQTAEGALAEVESMLQRMRELSVQAANGTNTLEDRTAIQNEIDELNKEIQRISDTTEFNTKRLLDGNLSRKTYSTNIYVNVLSMSDNVNIKDYKIIVTSDPAHATTTGAGGVTIGSVTSLQEGIIKINGEEIEIKQGETKEEVLSKIRDLCNTVGIDLTGVDAGGASTPITAGGARLKFTSKGYGMEEKINISCTNASLANALGITSILGSTVQGTDAVVSLESGFSDTTTTTVKGNIATIKDSDGFEMKIKISEGAKDASPIDAAPGANQGESKITVLDAGPMNLQIGANEGQLMEVTIPDVNPETLQIDAVNVCTSDNAQKAIGAFDNAIFIVSSVRAKLGAYQNRLDHAVESLDETSENVTEALSRIEDADMAEEMTTYTQNQVLTQANTAMLAQANERPQTILTLLQG